MKIVIHRGTQEIGGTCVELSTQNSRILIDFGIPLVAPTKDKPFDTKLLKDKSVEALQKLYVLPVVKGLYRHEAQGIDGILISHSHLDHYGLLNYVNQDIPVYLSQGAKELVDVSNVFTPNKIGTLNAKIVDPRKSFKVGDFTITPYLVDHSAFDALAFLIKADGRNVFYSGDFRGHGRKSILFKQMIKNPVKNVDCLLMEGTMIGRGKQTYSDEQAIEKRITEVLEEHSNITFISLSSQNIDRIVSAYRACLKTGCIFVIDAYTAFVLEKLAKVSKGIPQYNWKNIRIKFFNHHVNCLKNAGHGDLLNRYSKRKIDIPEIKRERNKILMLARDNSIFPLLINKIGDVLGARIIYSIWEGYLIDKFKEYSAQNGLIIEQIHTSGHADVADLKAFAHALNPKTLIPIHTFQAKDYPKLFSNVKILKDGEEFFVTDCLRRY